MFLIFLLFASTECTQIMAVSLCLQKLEQAKLPARMRRTLQRVFQGVEHASQK